MSSVQQKEYIVEAGQEWSVDLFRPEDAEGVTNLFRSVYGRGYPIKAYVDPELLRRENAAGRIISSVARTAKGDIVGHNALFNSAPCHKIFESGAGLVHADYRGGHGIFTEMVAHGIEIGARDFGVELVYGEPVCNHVFSQKLCHNQMTLTRAFEVDLMPAATYSKEASASGRVSTMLGFRTLRPYPHEVYLPPLYEVQLREIYAQLDDRRILKSGDRLMAPESKTELACQVFAFAGVVRIAVNSHGVDLVAALAAEERRLQPEGIEIFQVWLKLGHPDVGAAAAALKQAGYFFGGLLPRWFDEDGLLMQKTTSPPNWENINLHFDDDRKILQMVRDDWQS